MGQSEQFHEQWAYLRDHAKPIVPDDVYDLRAVREFQPPSRAHVKRIQRVRPVVVVARPRPDVLTADRLAHNEAATLGLAVSRLVRPNYHAAQVARPLPYNRPPPIEPGAPRITADHHERRAVAKLAESVRLASYGMIAKGRLEHMAEAVRNYHEI